MKTKLKDLKERWAEGVPKMLLAYRTTARTLTGETPFLLAYGYEPMVSVEIEDAFLRRENYGSDKSFFLQK